MSVYLWDMEKTWDRVVQGGLKSQRLIEGVSEGPSKWREEEVAYASQNSSPSKFPNPLHALSRFKKILSVLSLVRKHPTIYPPKEGNMSSNMETNQLFFLVCSCTHTHTHKQLTCIPAKHCKCYVQSPPEEFQVESTEIWTYQSIGHVTSTPFTVQVKSEYWTRTDTHLWACPVAWRGITLLCLRWQSFERNLDFLWFPLFQGRWEQPARLFLKQSLSCFIRFSYYQPRKQVNVALLDGGWLTVPVVKDWMKVPAPPILNLTTTSRWIVPPKLSSYFCEWKNNHTHLSPHCHRLDGLDNRHLCSYDSGGLRAQISIAV